MPAARRVVPASTEQALRTWAAQKRVLLEGRSESVACTLGRVLSERVAAGEGVPFRSQGVPEIYRGDGRAVQLIVITLSEFPRGALTTYYVLAPLRVPINEQAQALGVCRRAFWDYLHMAEAVVDSGLQLTAWLRPGGCTCGLSVKQLNGAR